MTKKAVETCRLCQQKWKKDASDIIRITMVTKINSSAEQFYGDQDCNFQVSRNFGLPAGTSLLLNREA